MTSHRSMGFMRADPSRGTDVPLCGYDTNVLVRPVAQALGIPLSGRLPIVEVEHSTKGIDRLQLPAIDPAAQPHERIVLPPARSISDCAGPE
jgi:hypothetical protein